MSYANFRQVIAEGQPQSPVASTTDGAPSESDIDEDARSTPTGPQDFLGGAHFIAAPPANVGPAPHLSLPQPSGHSGFHAGTVTDFTPPSNNFVVLPAPVSDNVGPPVFYNMFQEPAQVQAGAYGPPNLAPPTAATFNPAAGSSCFPTENVNPPEHDCNALEFEG